MPVDFAPYKDLPEVALVGRLIRQWWQLEIAFADEQGYVASHADGNIVPSANAFCRQALFSKEGFKACNESVRVVRDRLRAHKTARTFVHQCHLGFDVVAAPIHFDGALVGFLFTGGSYSDDAPPVAKADLLRKVRGYDTPFEATRPMEPEDLESEWANIPRLSNDKREMLSQLVAAGAGAVMRYHADVVKPRAERLVRGRDRKRFREIVGDSPAMHDVFDLLDKVARSQTTVLIHGESGTGKELIARAIHDYGPRAKKPFVVQNCSAFNDNLLESSLFGHARGAFTGAVKDQKGLFELADGGTFFLDEIGDMSPALQVKLLRVLQEGTFTPLGSTQEIRVDVRIIAASHKDLSKLVERGEFREDLYYRVNVLKVIAPPMRDRSADLPLLVEHFLRKHNQRSGEPPRLSTDTMTVMGHYSWPGNIRELENEIERLMVLGTEVDVIEPELLSPRIQQAAPVESAMPAPVANALDAAGAHGGASLKELVESVESQVIAQGLIRTHWNKSQLAKELGISRSNLIQKCNYYGLERKDGRR